MDYFDRAGRAIVRAEWVALFEDDSYKVVARQVLPNGRVVSTVWVGIGPALWDIFETMVFPAVGEYAELDVQRYATEAEAVAGHERMVRRWGGTMPA